MNVPGDVLRSAWVDLYGIRGSLTDIAAFVAKDPEKEAIVVAIRGTASFANTLTE